MDNILRIDVCEHIKNLAGDDIVYLYPNPGNAGDSIIALGTFHAFSDYNIKYEFLDLTKPFDSNGKIVLYSGGGNLVKYYSDARKFLETHSSKAKRIIILPHTITDNQELLSGLGNNVDLISRELISYKYVSNIVTDANVYISDDMAFYMNSSRALSMKKISLMSCLLKTIIYRILNNDKAKSIPSPLRYLYILVLSFKKKRHLSLEKHKILNAFRTDVESTDVDIPNDNIDISRIYSFGTLDK